MTAPLEPVSAWIAGCVAVACALSGFAAGFAAGHGRGWRNGRDAGRTEGAAGVRLELREASFAQGACAWCGAAIKKPDKDLTFGAGRPYAESEPDTNLTNA